MQRETLFKEKVVKKLKEFGEDVYFTKIQQVAKLGDLDIHMCIRGRFIAWELKTDDGVESKLQKYVATKIRKAGGVAMLVTPSNLNESLGYIRKVLSNLE